MLFVEALYAQGTVCTYSNMIFLPFSSVPPNSLPTTYPIYAPVTIVTGHFCHSRSLCKVSAFSINTQYQSLPVQRNGHSAQPGAQYCTNATPIHFINWQQKRYSLSPGLTTNSVYIDERQCA